MIAFRFRQVLLYIDIIPPEDGLQMGPKHVEVWQLNKLKVISASCWFIIQYNLRYTVIQTKLIKI
jgi:hypothetical protein